MPKWLGGLVSVGRFLAVSARWADRGTPATRGTTLVALVTIQWDEV